MNWETHELVSDLIRYQCKNPTDEPNPSIWYDQGPVLVFFADRRLDAFWTPAGIHSIFMTFQSLIEEPKTGYTKRRIKREVLSNPHLHTKLKRRLLWMLKKASGRNDARGAIEADRDFIDRIQSVSSKKEVRILRRDIENHTCIPERTRENLLYNLSNYEARLDSA